MAADYFCPVHLPSPAPYRPAYIPSQCSAYLVHGSFATLVTPACLFPATATSRRRSQYWIRDERRQVRHLTNGISTSPDHFMCSNHPLSHLMQSVFGLHDRSRVRVFMYTTSPWDGTSYRPKISGSVEVFVDAATWSSEQIVKHIIDHKIHVCMSLYHPRLML